MRSPLLRIRFYSKIKLSKDHSDELVAIYEHKKVLVTANLAKSSP